MTAISLDIDALVDAMIGGLEAPFKTLRDRIKALEERPQVDANALRDEIADVKRRLLDVEAEMERAAERADLNRKGLQMSLDQAVSDLQTRRG